jgi:aminoglycoside phosphotransferase (APT) family kinase protein
VEAASDGRLVVVYRVRVDNATFYLRLAEAPGEDLTIDAEILGRLRKLGVSVPAVVAAEAAPAELDRSCMIVTEVPGHSLAHGGTDEEARRAARAAGRDTAVINSLNVQGFGWIRRTGTQPLTAELSSYGEFAASYLPERWPGWLAGPFEQSQLDALEALVEAERARPVHAARLVHGDLDVTHIYICDGRYRGIIDFGEMRGADLYFDLGHFMLHDGETRPVELFDSFLAGYAEVTGLPGDHRETIRVSAILVGLRQLSLWLGPERGRSPKSRLVRLRVAELANLLEGKPAAQRCSGRDDDGPAQDTRAGSPFRAARSPRSATSRTSPRPGAAGTTPAASCTASADGPPPKPKPTTTLTKATATRLPQSTLPGKALPDLLMLRNLAGMPPTVAAQ